MASDKSMQIDIVGLKELQRELKRLDLAKDLKDTNLQAAKVVADKGRANARALGGVAARIAPTIKAAAEQRRAKVQLGGSRNPEALGAEFGGRGRPTTMQFQPHRGREGYALYPAVRETRDQFIDVYDRALQQLLARAFPD